MHACVYVQSTGREQTTVLGMISAPCMLGVRPALAALLLFCALGAAAPPQDEERDGEEAEGRLG